jgi:hypothetical protein
MALHCTALHCTTLHYDARTALHCTALLHCAERHCAALHCGSRRCAALHYAALRCVALRCTTALRRTAALLHCGAGQIEGAFIQGFGWCTMEELIWGDSDHQWVRPGNLFTQGPGMMMACRGGLYAACCLLPLVSAAAPPASNATGTWAWYGCVFKRTTMVMDL